MILPNVSKLTTKLISLFKSNEVVWDGGKKK